MLWHKGPREVGIISTQSFPETETGARGLVFVRTYETARVLVGHVTHQFVHDGRTRRCRRMIDRASVRAAAPPRDERTLSSRLDLFVHPEREREKHARTATACYLEPQEPRHGNGVEPVRRTRCGVPPLLPSALAPHQLARDVCLCRDRLLRQGNDPLPPSRSRSGRCSRVDSPSPARLRRRPGLQAEGRRRGPRCGRGAHQQRRLVCRK